MASYSKTTYPTKPRQKAPSKTPNKSQEAKLLSSFKSPPQNHLPSLSSSITSLAFDPSHPKTLAATHAASLSLFPLSPSQSQSHSHPITPSHTLHKFKDTSFSASFRSDGHLLAASSLSGCVHIFNVKSSKQLRLLKGHTRPVHVSKYPGSGDKLHLYSGGDDGVVKYWDVATETCVRDFLGHRDYVRGGFVSPVDHGLFFSGSYDHTVKVWDVRGTGNGTSNNVMGFNHGKPVEDVVVLPSGGLVATAGGNVVKIWDVIGGGRCVGTMESHVKTVTSLCVGKVGSSGIHGEGEGLGEEYRLLSVSLDGYLKVFDYARMKVTFSMRYPAPLVSVAFSPDCSIRAVGSSNGIIYVGMRKKGKVELNDGGEVVGFRNREGAQRKALKPSSFRYFHRGQGEKPREGDYLVLKPKKVKLTEHDKLLKKFRHKDAFVAVLRKKNPDYVVAVMEELVARKKLFKCVSNLDIDELEILLKFLQKYTTVPRFAGLLMPFANKVIQMRAEDVRTNHVLKVQINNFRRSIQEELRIQQSLLEMQGLVSPLMRIAGRS